MFNKKDFIRIQAPRIKRKYKVTVYGDITMGSFNNSTIVESEWILTIQEMYNDGSFMMELITLDSEVIKSKNEAFKEISIVANQFKKATTEVICVVNKSGKIIDIINIDQIKEKWDRTKKDLISFSGQTVSVEDFFKIDDEKFNKDVLKELVNQLEFFQLYFNNIYGTYIPNTEWRINDNALKTNKLEYLVKYEKKENSNNELRLDFKSIDLNINEKWIKKSYGQYPNMVNIDSCKPNISIEGEYIFDKNTGLINNARFLWDENVSSALKLRTEYHINKMNISTYGR